MADEDDSKPCRTVIGANMAVRLVAYRAFLRRFQITFQQFPFAATRATANEAAKCRQPDSARRGRIFSDGFGEVFRRVGQGGALIYAWEFGCNYAA